MDFHDSPGCLGVDLIHTHARYVQAASVFLFALHRFGEYRLLSLVDHERLHFVANQCSARPRQAHRSMQDARVWIILISWDDAVCVKYHFSVWNLIYL